MLKAKDGPPNEVLGYIVVTSFKFQSSQPQLHQKLFCTGTVPELANSFPYMYA